VRWDDSRSVEPVAILQPYVKSYAAFYCPDRDSKITDQTYMGCPWNTGDQNLGYAPNYGVWYYNTGQGIFEGVQDAQLGTQDFLPGKALGRFPNPAGTILLGDTNGAPFYTLLPSLQSADGTTPGVIRHSGMYSYAFVDGHIKAIKVAAYRVKTDFAIMPEAKDGMRQFCYDVNAMYYDGAYGQTITCGQQADDFSHDRVPL
jgi:prepilin-type processing-associated H-X9-DG protein